MAYASEKNTQIPSPTSQKNMHKAKWWKQKHRYKNIVFLYKAIVYGLKLKGRMRGGWNMGGTQRAFQLIYNILIFNILHTWVEWVE